MTDPQSGTPTITERDWLAADPAELKHFVLWMSELTRQKLHDKADIATVLALYEARITALTEQLTACGEMIIKLEAECDHLTDRAEQAEAEVIRLSEDGEFKQYMKFYAVGTISGLVHAQAQHIEKLQEKLPKPNERYFTRPRG